VHGIIQEHGGQIEVESEVQKGTAFHILLPLARFESKVAVA
jgi:signal transduction histidine kinase